jgi:hypothetical protein
MENEKKEQPGKKKKERIEITELFMAKKGKKGWEDCFMGVIYREKDESGIQIAVNGNVTIGKDGKIWSRDVNEDAYGENLDNIVELRLDFGLHDNPGVTSVVADQSFSHN